MESITKNDRYEIQVEPSKNRIYVKVIGFWRNVEDVPNYVSDIEKAVARVTDGFSLLVDLREAKTPPRAIGQQIHAKAQQTLVKNKVGKIAEVMDSAILKMATTAHSNAANITKQVFQSLKEAERWLDE